MKGSDESRRGDERYTRSDLSRDSVAVCELTNKFRSVNLVSVYVDL